MINKTVNRQSNLLFVLHRTFYFLKNEVGA